MPRIVVAIGAARPAKVNRIVSTKPPVVSRIILKNSEERSGFGSVNTIGGMVFGLFGRVPRSGETVNYDRFKYRVEKMKGSRILSLHMSLLSPKPKTEKEKEDAANEEAKTN